MQKGTKNKIESLVNFITSQQFGDRVGFGRGNLETSRVIPFELNISQKVTSKTSLSKTTWV